MAALLYKYFSCPTGAAYDFFYVQISFAFLARYCWFGPYVYYSSQRGRSGA